MGSIRLFLAIAVVGSHAVALDFDIMPGKAAVQAFFIISGFYMSLILNEKYKRSGLFVFYTNRFLRLFPTYWFVLLLSLIALYSFDVGVFTRPDKLERALTNGPFLALSYLWTNIAVLGQEILFVLGIDTPDYLFYWNPSGNASVKAWSFVLVPQAWSLSMECYFYLLAPFILRRRVQWVVVVFLASLGLRFFIVSRGAEYDLFLRRFFPAELCLFLCGYFSYLIFHRVKRYDLKYSTGLLSWAVLLSSLLLYSKINEEYSLALLAVIMTLSVPFIFNMTKDNKIDRFLGNISFPIYMVHFLVIAFLEDYVPEYSLWILLPPVCLAALGVHYGIEMPIDRWRQRRIKDCRTRSDDVHSNEAWLPMSTVKATV